MEKIKKNLSKGKHWLIFAIIVIVIYKILDNFGNIGNFLGNFFNIVAPILFGVLTGYLLYIPESKIERTFTKSKSKFLSKKAKGLSILTTYVIAILVIIVVINFIWPVVKSSIIELVNNFQEYYEIALQRYNRLPDDSILKSEAVDEFIYNIRQIDLKDFINVENLTIYAKGALSVASSLFDIFVTIVVSVYVLFEKDDIVKFIKKAINAFLKKSTATNINKYMNSTNEIFSNFIAAQFLDAIIVGILVTVGMKILGVKYAVLLGFMIAVFNLIPYFGAIVAVSIAILITVITGGLSQAIWMAIVVIILQQIDANIINPKILGNSLKISPILVILSVTIGGAYFGVLGMFLAVPVAAVLKIVISDYIDYKAKENVIE